MGAYSAPQTHSWIKGATSKGGEKDGRGKEGNRRKGEVTEGKGGTLHPHNVENRLMPLSLKVVRELKSLEK